MKTPKVALIHDYLVQYGGAEKTLEAIVELFPNSDIYTGLYDKKNLSEIIKKQNIIYPKNSVLKMFPKHLTFLMPLIFEGFDLRRYDIIISDGTAWPKGVLTRPDQLHISYIHTPPRFLYKYSVESSRRDKWYYRPFVAFIDNYLRIWDFSAAQRPDYLVANSQETRRRINKFYKRDATVIYPPVEINAKTIPTEKFISAENNNLQQPYYLAVGRLSKYKNFHILIEAFNLLELPLVIVGTGPEEGNLRRTAKANIKFVGSSEKEKLKAFQECLGFIFPVVEEDFGIVVIEAMSYGKPVLAHKSGGVLETIHENLNGMFFDTVDTASLVNVIKIFDQNIKRKLYEGNKIKESVRKFSKERFKEEFKSFVDEKWEEKCRNYLKSKQ